MHAAETSPEGRSSFLHDPKGKVARELEQAGYVVRSRTRSRKGQLAHAEYIIYVHPMPVSRSAPKPEWEKPVLENPMQEKPAQEDPAQLKKQEFNTIQKKRNQSLLSILSFRKSASRTAGGRGWNISSSITCCRTTRALLDSLTRSWP